MCPEAKALPSTLTNRRELTLKLSGGPADLPNMEGEFLPDLFGSVVNLVALCIFIAGVMKVFQVASTLNEIRDAVKDIQRNQDVLGPVGRPAPLVATAQSGDEMLRALDAELHLSADSEPAKPEIINPR